MLSREEIKSVLDDFRCSEEWFYPCLALLLGTDLRNAEVIGFTWDCVRLEEERLLISKAVRRDRTFVPLYRNCSGRFNGYQWNLW